MWVQVEWEWGWEEVALGKRHLSAEWQQHLWGERVKNSNYAPSLVGAQSVTNQGYFIKYDVTL